MKKCIFCQIVKNKINSKKIYENKDLIVILDAKQTQKTRGHVLVITKKHYDDFLSVPKNIINKLIKIAYDIGQITKKLKAKGVKILTNIGRESGQTIMHCHVHVIPYKINKKVKINSNKNKLIDKYQSLINNQN